jgi:transposase
MVMQTQITAIPKLYIGMDIHKKSWAVHFRTDLFDHRGFTMPPEPLQLENYVEENFSDYEVYITYESGCCGFSAARYFSNLGWHTVVVNAADIPRMNKQNYQKTDRIDCRNLSKQLQAGQLRAIHIPTEGQDHLRSLVRQRNCIVRQLRQSKLQIKGMLLYLGVKIPEQYDNPNWSKAFQEWLKNIEWVNITASYSMQSKLRILEVLHKEYLNAANQLRSYCRTHHKKDYYLLKSIAGIGGYLAAALLGELGDIRRFDNEKQFSSYIGMIPSMRNSGSSENTLGITPRSKSLVRSYLIEAAWVTIRRDPEMQAYYRKHFGKNVKNVIVKVAHKLVKRILSVIKNERPYTVNYRHQTQASLRLD